MIWNVTVLPRLKTKEITCETTIGNYCKFRIQNSEYKLETKINQESLKIKARRSYFEVKSQNSGKITVYLKSYTGDYYTHKLNIIFKPRPPKIYY